jgi:hypothetical protein
VLGWWSVIVAKNGGGDQVVVSQGSGDYESIGLDVTELPTTGNNHAGGETIVNNDNGLIVSCV